MTILEKILSSSTTDIGIAIGIVLGSSLPFIYLLLCRNKVIDKSHRESFIVAMIQDIMQLHKPGCRHLIYAHAAFSVIAVLLGLPATGAAFALNVLVILPVANILFRSCSKCALISSIQNIKP